MVGVPPAPGSGGRTVGGGHENCDVPLTLLHILPLGVDGWGSARAKMGEGRELGEKGVSVFSGTLLYIFFAQFPVSFHDFPFVSRMLSWLLFRRHLLLWDPGGRPTGF